MRKPWDPRRAPAWRGPPGESGGARSPFLDPQSAGRRPFLDAGEIVIGAVAVRPHRQVQGGIGFVFVLEFAKEDFELLSGVVRSLVRRLRRIVVPDLQFQRTLLARRIVAAELDIDEYADGRT